ncbi:pimeloyl-ACP methyl ester carboxylesterase [Paraburkholderia sp. GAS199]
MAYFTTKDGTQLYYKDWGTGQPITFSHGWPLDADAWDSQMMFLAERGYRVIAHDRRGHGRSAQTWGGNEMNTYADDLSELIESLDLRNAVMVGHSTGGRRGGPLYRTPRYGASLEGGTHIGRAANYAEDRSESGWFADVCLR